MCIGSLYFIIIEYRLSQRNKNMKLKNIIVILHLIHSNI